MSAVVLDQLPLLVNATHARALLSDDLLRRPPTYVSEESVRSRVHVTSQFFFTRMMEHFAALMRCHCLTAARIAHTFAPYVISEDSPYEPKVGCSAHFDVPS